MTAELKIRKVGNSLGVTLTEPLKELGLGEGDSVFLVQTPDGILLTPYDPDFAEAMEDARSFMKDYPNAMRELAK
ncbi:MAG: AbrB/MazE/SpoVT family DNA-binding domain-containing protein [Alphaproteobacteria bacterium]